MPDCRSSACRSATSARAEWSAPASDLPNPAREYAIAVVYSPSAVTNGAQVSNYSGPLFIGRPSVP